MKKLGLILGIVLMATSVMAEIPMPNIEDNAVTVRAENVKKMSERADKNIRTDCHRLFNALWSGASIEEAQGVLDLYGDKAASLFLLHKSYQDFIVANIDVNWEYLVPPYEPNINWEDGSVLLTEWPVSEVVEEEVVEPVVDEGIYE